MFTSTTPQLRPQEFAPKNQGASLSPSKLALYAAAALLGAASLTLATTYGWHRGTDLTSSAIWSAVGLAVGLIALTAPRLMRQGAPKSLMVPLYAMALAFAVAAALGNAAGGRQHHAAVEAAGAATTARQQAAYGAANAALAKLPTTRPVAVIEHELESILKDVRLHDCRGWLENAKLRQTCIAKAEPARAELANAVEHARLTAIMDSASGKLDAKPSAPANTDAATLARYLRAVGVAVTPETVGDWLVILAVLVLEVGPGLALAAAGTGGTVARMVAAPAAQIPAQSPPAAQIPPPAGSVPVQPVPLPKPFVPKVDSAPETESDQITERLAQGAVHGTQRDLAALFGLPVTSFRRRVESNPRLKLTATPNGSKLELVA